MATVRKILGQSKPAATTDATLYTVAATDAVISTLVVAESGAAGATFRICVDSAGGTTTAVGKAIAWNVAIAANSIVTLTLGITLATSSTIVVQGSTANLTFTAFGQENS